MGQYHYVVNLDKKEFIHPHMLGVGLKLWEQMAAHPGTSSALIALLACSNGRGGGDLHEDEIVGRWAGDRIAIVGDYGQDDDLPGNDPPASEIYALCSDETWHDVSADIAALIERELEGKFVGDGWRDWQPVNP
jgi:hypothetical protein